MNRREFLLAAASAALTGPAAAARLGGGTPVALVTADLESRVLAVDAADGRVVKRIGTLAGPRSIETVGQYAVVAHSTDAALTIVHAPTLEIRHVIDAVDEPRYSVADATGLHAFVTDSGTGELVVVDVVRGRVVARLALGGPARHLGISPSARTVWAALGTKAERIAVVDVRNPRRPQLLTRFRPPFLAHDVGFARGGKRVWVTSGNERRIALYDPQTREVLRLLDAGTPPQHVTFCGRRAHVTSGDDGILSVHRLGDGAVLRRTRIPIGSYNVQEGWGRVVTPSLSQGTLCTLNEQGRLLLNVRAARSSHDACFVVSA